MFDSKTAIRLPAVLVALACVARVDGQDQEIRTERARASQAAGQLATQAARADGLDQKIKSLQDRARETLAEKAATTNEKVRELEQLTSQRNGEIGKLETKRVLEDQVLRAAMRKAMAEMRAGLFCAACKRPPSRIKQEENEEFADHIRRVGKGTVGATAEMIQKEQAIWDGKIQVSWEKLTKQIDSKRKSWDQRIESTGKRFDAKIASLDARLVTLREQRDEATAEQRAAKDRGYAAKSDYYDAVYDEHSYVSAKRVVMDTRRRQAKWAADDARHELTRAQAAYDRLNSAYSTKWPMKPSETPIERLAERRADHDRVIAALDATRPLVKKLEAARRAITAEEEQIHDFEAGYKQHRSAEHERVEQSWKKLSQSHSSIPGVDWLFDRAANERPKPPQPVPISRSLSEALAGTAESLEPPTASESSVRELWRKSKLAKALKAKVRSVSLKAFRNALEGKDLFDEPDAFAPIKSWVNSRVERLKTDATAFLMYGKPWSRLPNVLQKDVEFWKSSFERIRNPLSLRRGFDHVEKLGALIGAIGDDILDDF